MKVHRRGNWGVIEFAYVAHTFEISAVNQLAFPGVLPLYNHTLWGNEPFKIGKWKIVPNWFDFIHNCFSNVSWEHNNELKCFVLDVRLAKNLFLLG